MLDGDALWSLVEGLEANGLLQNGRYTHLLTGACGWLSLARGRAGGGRNDGRGGERRAGGGTTGRGGE